MYLPKCLRDVVRTDVAEKASPTAKRNYLAAVGAPRQEAELPFVLYAKDLAKLFQKSVDAAREAIKRGDYGAWFKDGRRPAVRRETLLRYLRDKEIPIPEEPRRPSVTSRAERLAERIARRVRQRREEE